MADSSLLGAIFQTLIPAAVQALLDELAMPDEVREDLDGLIPDVSMLQAYLRDAAQKQQTNEAVRLWLSNLQDVAYDANDLLDEWALEIQRQKMIPLAPVRNSLSQMNLKRRQFLHHISKRIKSMKVKMEEIVNQGHRYGLQQVQERPPITSNESSSLEPPLILGREDDKRTIIDLLLRPSVAGDSTTSVICIVGIGGLGKTALAQSVYNDEDVRQRFTLTSWVHVSQDFKVVKLTKNILESIGGLSQTSVSLDNLQRELLNKLRGNKYLLVLDEVWIQDWRQWHNFKIPLLQGAMGSKILVTTRTIEAADAMGASTTYRLKLIRDEDCLELFFHNMSLHNPKINVNYLRSFSEVIAQKCNGLPSAAEDLALRLCQEPDRSRWSSILDTQNLQNSDRFRVDLSYQLLPDRLKQCFALCSLFPNGFEFDKEDLINLWMAQNFIQPSDDQRMEDVGSSYFDLLQRRSLFQYSRFDRRSNRSKYIFHNSIHDLARSASRGECLIAKPGQRIEKARHLSLVCQEAAETDLTKDFSHNQLRFIYTLVVFGDYFDELPDDFTKKLKNLRVLDLSNTILQKLPNSIDQLKHIRYLQLRGTKIKTLPNELSELYFLQTLGLGNCYMLEELPKGIKYLQKLRHIDLYWDIDSMLMAGEDISWSSITRHSLRIMPPKIGLLINLQTLSRFVVGKKRGCGLEELENLNQLHGELLVSNLHLVQRVAEATKAKLKAKKELQCLELHWGDVEKEALKFSPTFRRKGDVERIIYELKPHNNLRGLRIFGYMGKSFPGWLESSYLCNLSSLTLVNCRQCPSLPKLGNLPLLAELHIEGMASVRYVDCAFCVEGNATPFRTLKKLHFENLPILKQWCGNKGCALNALRELVIRNCSMLEKITHNMPSLEKLVIEKSPRMNRLPNLQSLHSLELKRSGEKFRELFSSLTSLCSLSLKGLSTKYIPEELQHGLLNSLKCLEINSCNELECFPDTWPPTSLVYFGVKNCPKLLLLPNDLKKLRVLEDMEIQSCPQLSCLPEEVGNLKSLVHLDISNCKGLLSLPSFLPDTLQNLSISRCPGLKERCKPKGEDWQKIRNIFSLWIDGTMVSSPIPQGMT